MEQNLYNVDVTFGMSFPTAIFVGGKQNKYFGLDPKKHEQNSACLYSCPCSHYSSLRCTEKLLLRVVEPAGAIWDVAHGTAEGIGQAILSLAAQCWIQAMLHSAKHSIFYMMCSAIPMCNKNFEKCGSILTKYIHSPFPEVKIVSESGKKNPLRKIVF